MGLYWILKLTIAICIFEESIKWNKNKGIDSENY